MAALTREQQRFANAADKMEARTRQVSAFAIVNPKDPEQWGKVVFYRTTGGGMYVTAWLPAGETGARGAGTFNHAGHAGGYGYNKQDACMAGAKIANPDNAGYHRTIEDDSGGWRRQVERLGYIVIQTV